MSNRKKGLFQKYLVRRLDGKDAAGKKHQGCQYFVLDVVHDPHAIPALKAYAKSCRKDYPKLAADLAKLWTIPDMLDFPNTGRGHGPRGCSSPL